MQELLRMESVHKAFGGIQALNGVRFDLLPGEVHALMGENGAGKSTLIKILAGAYRADRGQIFLDSRPVVINSPLQANRAGIRVIYQEFNLVPGLTVAQNLFLGDPPVRRGFLDHKEMLHEARRALAKAGLNIDPGRRVKHLSVAEQQMVEIVKAITASVRILVLDEPTAALTERETEQLFGMIGELKRQGVGMIFISHRLGEVYRLADRITVLRDGGYIGTWARDAIQPDELIRQMVGRELKELFPKQEVPIGEPLLQVKGLSLHERFEQIRFDVRKGEIVALTGLMGAGRTEVVRALFGAESKSRGDITFLGRPVTIRSPSDAIQLGWGLVPEDRKRQGIIPRLSIRGNILLASAEQVSAGGLIRGGRARQLVDRFIHLLRVATNSREKKVALLSGGNQQKVVLARWLARNPRLLILDEPTRGIDVGAKAEIHRLMGDFAARGNAILMVTSELPEALGMADRILVMHEGRLVGEFDRKSATQEKIMRCALGFTEEA